MAKYLASVSQYLGKPGVYVAGAGDGTAIYASSTTLTLAGLAFSPSNVQFLGVLMLGSSGPQQDYPATRYRHTLSGNTLTVEGAAFEAGAVFLVVYCGQVKGYSAIPSASQVAILGKDYTGAYKEVPVTNNSFLLRVDARDYLFGVAEGDVTNHEAWEKIGWNPAVGVTEATVTPQGGNYVFPSAGMQMSMKSDDNTQDKAGGTGALTVTIYYLKATSYIEASETITLNGTTWVDTVATDIFRVNHIRVATTGTNGAPVGNISLADKATRLIIYGYILAGENRQKQAVWTVPISKALYVVQMDASSIHATPNKYTRIRFIASYDNKTGTVFTDGNHFVSYAEVVLSVSAIIKPFRMPFKFPAKTDIKVNVLSNAASASVSCLLEGWLEAA